MFVQEAVSVNDGTITAVLPASPDGGDGGITSIELSINGQDYTYGGASFTFTRSMYIAKISPPIIPAFSFFDIALFGENIGDVPRPLWCRIGAITQDAVWISDGMATCPTPESLEPGAYDVELSSNGEDFILSTTRLAVRPEVRLISASPLLGPSTGGTNAVAHGLGFRSSGERFQCVFGEEGVEAYIVSDTEIRCEVPAQQYSGSTPFGLAIDRSAYPSFRESQIRSTSDILDAEIVYVYYD